MRVDKMPQKPWRDDELWDFSFLPSQRSVVVVFTVIIVCLALFGIAGA